MAVASSTRYCRRGTGATRDSAAELAELITTNLAAERWGSGLQRLALEFPLGCTRMAPSNPTRDASPQAVKRTSTTPCCKLRRRILRSKRRTRLFDRKGRERIASLGAKRSERRKVWVCFR